MTAAILLLPPLLHQCDSLTTPVETVAATSGHGCRFDGQQVRLFCTDPDMLDQVTNTVADELEGLKAPERMLITMGLKAVRDAGEGKLYDCHKVLCCRPYLRLSGNQSLKFAA